MVYLIPPILYNGSSFNDITERLICSAKIVGIPMEVLKIEKKTLKGSGLENPKEYVAHSIKKLTFLLKKLKNGDKVIFVDFFCPGLDLVEYYLKRMNLSVKKIALMHGGSFVDHDLYSEFSWLNNFEKGWFDIYDKVVVPSNFFVKNLNKEQKKKIIVLPWGLDLKIKSEFNFKKFDVIFPHRLATDKGIDDLLYIIKKMPGVSFCITNVNKEIIKNSPPYIKNWYQILKKTPNVYLVGTESDSDHLKTLKKSKLILSTAYQEGFGYAVMKAILSGNIPVLPNRCCYPEYFSKKYLYNNLNEAINLINTHLKNYPNGYPKINYGKFNFDNLIKLIK